MSNPFGDDIARESVYADDAFDSRSVASGREETPATRSGFREHPKLLECSTNTPTYSITSASAGRQLTEQFSRPCFAQLWVF
jgi:hypothetical protein